MYFVEAIHKSAKGFCSWVRNFETRPFSDIDLLKPGPAQ